MPSGSILRRSLTRVNRYPKSRNIPRLSSLMLRPDSGLLTYLQKGTHGRCPLLFPHSNRYIVTSPQLEPRPAPHHPYPTKKANTNSDITTEQMEQVEQMEQMEQMEQVEQPL